MSYVPVVTPDAQLQLQSLEILAQEAALDAIDHLAEEFEVNVREPDVVLDWRYFDDNGRERWLFVHVLFEIRRGEVLVLGMGGPD